MSYIEAQVRRRTARHLRKHTGAGVDALSVAPCCTPSSPRFLNRTLFLSTRVAKRRAETSMQACANEGRQLGYMEAEKSAGKDETRRNGKNELERPDLKMHGEDLPLRQRSSNCLLPIAGCVHLK
eukprot:1119809-Pleurochrysis_carterae.AAC.1